MQQSLDHRFLGALVGALWGHHLSTSADAPLPEPSVPFVHWAGLAVPYPSVAAPLPATLLAQPLTFIGELLPLLLAYGDDERALRRWLKPLTPESEDHASTATIALEGVYALRGLVEAIICERPRLEQSILRPMPQPLTYLSPYLKTALSPHLRGAGMVQIYDALGPLSGVHSIDPAAHQASMALALAVYSALKTRDYPDLAARRVAHLLPQDLASPAAAIAGFLCGLQAGLSGLSLPAYRMLETAHLPLASNHPLAPTDANPLGPAPTPPGMTPRQMGQILLATWSGAVQPQLTATAIAAPNVIRVVGS